MDEHPASLSSSRPKRAISDGSDSRSNAKRSRMNDITWDEMFQCLVKYKEEHGDCLVPRKYEPDPKLAGWVEQQRALWNRDYRENSKEPISQSSQRATPTELPATDVPTTTDRQQPDEWVDDLEAIVRHDDPLVDDNKKQENRPGGFVGPDDGGLDSLDIVALPSGDMARVQANPDGVAMGAIPKLTQAQKDRLDAIGFVWCLRTKRVDEHWEEMFQELVKFKNEHGDCLVPSRHENKRLGKWVETQRYEYTKLQRTATEGTVATKRMTEDRIRKLESIGFEWKVKNKMKRHYDRQWDQMFERMLKFKEENSHCAVPKRFPPDQRLATWVHTQRIQYRKLVGIANDLESSLDDNSPKLSAEEEISFRLTDERRLRLEQIGFLWNAREAERTAEHNPIMRNSYDDQWDAMFNQLKAYKEKYGHCLVPKRFNENRKLGTWVDTQRVQYKKMKKKLTADTSSSEPTRSARDGSESDNAPTAETKTLVGRLTVDRISRLEELGFVWAIRDDWHKHFEELKEFKRQHGNCNVPARYHSNRRLGIFVSAQRQQYKALQTLSDQQRRSAQLTDERIDMLNEIGFTWTIRSRDILGESWNERFQDLKAYKAIHGNCLVPSRYPSCPELAGWVGTQRTQYRLYTKAKGERSMTIGSTAMTDDRISQLEELGFVWAVRGAGDGKKGTNKIGDVVEPETRDSGELTSHELHNGTMSPVGDDATMPGSTHPGHVTGEHEHTQTLQR